MRVHEEQHKTMDKTMAEACRDLAQVVRGDPPGSGYTVRSRVRSRITQLLDRAARWHFHCLAHSIREEVRPAYLNGDVDKAAEVLLAHAAALDTE